MTQQNIHNRPNRSYELVAYDSTWATKFESMREEIAPIFGDNLIAIEHIGSTSVPGMIAKPQIDAVVIVKDLKQVKLEYTAMSKHGFDAMGNFIQKSEPEEYFVKDDENDKRLFSVHVMQKGNPEIESMITLRDYLRVEPEAREAYISHKQALMGQHSASDYNSYSRGKVEFIEDINAKARAWRNAQAI